MPSCLWRGPAGTEAPGSWGRGEVYRKLGESGSLQEAWGEGKFTGSWGRGEVYRKLGERECLPNVVLLPLVWFLRVDVGSGVGRLTV